MKISDRIEPILCEAAARFHNRTGDPPQVLKICPEWHGRLQQELRDKAFMLGLIPLGEPVGEIISSAFGGEHCMIVCDEIPELFRFEKLPRPADPAYIELGPATAAYFEPFVDA